MVLDFLGLLFVFIPILFRSSMPRPADLLAACAMFYLALTASGIHCET